ncbi:MAG TPA: Gfo/Idh/MocA family oxidoreductase [Opitutaceae bacterium]|nr:Gfo/Idh/MocA family oxidoreductase [Opitutaceae bacterium]
MSEPLDPIGFAIVGSGSIAAFHAAAIAATRGAKLVAVCSRSADKAKTFAATVGAAAEPTLEALLARRDVEVVCVATPSGRHRDIALPALRAGKHVLCEKPLEITTERVDEMIATAEERGLILAGVFQQRFGPGAQRLKHAVVEGRFGKLTLCSAYVKWWRDRDYYTSSTWKGTAALDGGGALMNQGIHAVDLLQWLAGMPTSVVAQTRVRVHPIETEDTVVALLDFAGGALGVIEASTACYPGSSLRIELMGERGTAVLENGAITDWRFADERPGDAEIRAQQVAGASGGAADPKAIGIEGHRTVMVDLVSALREGRSPAVPGREARNAVAIVEAIYQSHRTGGRVQLDPQNATRGSRARRDYD